VEVLMIKFFKHLKALNESKRFFREKAAQGQPLCIMDDKVFKLMLASETEDSKEALRNLLSVCTRREVTEVKVLNNELLPVYYNAKSPRLDVKVTFNNGEIANLEMQIDISNDDLKNRASSYAALLQAGQMKKGEKYKEVKRVYQIFFLNCVLFPESSKFPRRYGLREEKEYDLLTENLEIIFYEMPKVENSANDYLAKKIGIESFTKDEKWCIYMKYRHEKIFETLINELCTREEGIMHAEKQVTKINRSFRKYLRWMDEEKNKIDLWYKLKNARDEGRDEEKHNIARNALTKGFSVEIVQEITGLEISIIENLKN